MVLWEKARNSFFDRKLLEVDLEKYKYSVSNQLSTATYCWLDRIWNNDMILQCVNGLFTSY